MSHYNEEREALYEAWDEGEVRMENIVPNGNNGEHYKETASYIRAIQDSDMESTAVTPSKYHRRIESKDGWSDVYSVTEAYGVTSAPIAHAIKKLLCTGTRGYKDFHQDLQEAIDSLERAKDFPPIPF